MASGAAITADEIGCTGNIAARHGNSNILSSALSFPKRSGDDRQQGDNRYR
jgi:hypothetical protein